MNNGESLWEAIKEARTVFSDGRKEGVVMFIPLDFDDFARRVKENGNEARYLVFQQNIETMKRIHAEVITQAFPQTNK